MDSTQLVLEMRRWAYIGSGTQFTDFTDADCLNMLTSRLRADFSKFIVDSREGYWQKTTLVTGVTDTCPVPPRAVLNGVHSIYFLNNNRFVAMDEAQSQDMWLFQQTQGTGAPNPRKYTIQADDIYLLPTPTNATTLQIKFYLRPSVLCTSQNSISGTDRGRITSITPGVSITVNALPFNMQATVPAAITTANSFDVVRVSGWYTPTFYSQPIASIVGTTITPTDPSWITAASVKVGDYIRCENQTDWPQLPDEFHECLAQDGAAAVLNQITFGDKLDRLNSKLGTVFERFKQSVSPRAQWRSKPALIRGPGY